MAQDRSGTKFQKPIKARIINATAVNGTHMTAAAIEIRNIFKPRLSIGRSKINHSKSHGVERRGMQLRSQLNLTRQPYREDQFARLTFSAHPCAEGFAQAVVDR